MADERSVGEATSCGFIDHLYDAAGDAESQTPHTEAEQDVHAFRCSGTGCLHRESGSPMKLPGEQLRGGLCKGPWAVPKDPVASKVVVAVREAARCRANFWIVTVGIGELVDGPGDPHVVEAMRPWVRWS